MNTARFANLVAACGTPEPYTLWVRPEEDAFFQKALKAQRVLTVHQATVGSTADYGTVGFDDDQGKDHPEFLLFPKSLKAFAGKRVVGVKYDLLKPPETLPQRRAVPKKKVAGKPSSKPPAPPAAPPPPAAEIQDARDDAPSARKAPESESDPEPSPARESVPKASAKRLPVPVPRAAAVPAGTDHKVLDELRREVRRAIRELEQGKAVAAHQRLTKLMERAG